MKNMKLNDFFNLMYERQEIEFSYNGRIYNFELSSEDLDPTKPLTVNLYEVFENGNGICVNKFLYNEDTYIKDVNAFIEMPLFDGKSLVEIDREITVLYNS